MKIRNVLKSFSRMAAVLLVMLAATSGVFAQSGAVELEPKVLMIYFGKRSQQLTVEVQVLREMFPTVPIDWIQANDSQELEAKLREYVGSPRYFFLSGHGPKSISDPYSFGEYQFNAFYSKFQERFPYKAQVYFDSCRAGMNNNVGAQGTRDDLSESDRLYHVAQYVPGNGVIDHKLNIYSHFGNKDVFLPTLTASTVVLKAPQDSKLCLTANFFDYLKDNLANGSVEGFYKELSSSLLKKHHTIADESSYIKNPEDITVVERYIPYGDFAPGYVVEPYIGSGGRYIGSGDFVDDYVELVETPRVVEKELDGTKELVSVETEDYWPAKLWLGELEVAPRQIRIVRIATKEKYPVARGEPVDELEKFPQVAEKLRESKVPLSVEISDYWPVNSDGTPGPAQLRTVRVATKEQYPVFRRPPLDREYGDIIEQYPFYVPGTKE